MKNQTHPDSSILASIIPLAILFVLIQATSLIGFFHYSFQAVEEYAIKKNLLSCIDSMQTESDRIGSVVFEWSAWDACAAFIKTTIRLLKENMAKARCRTKPQRFLYCGRRRKTGLDPLCQIPGRQGRAVNLTLFSEVLEKFPLWKFKDPNGFTAAIIPPKRCLMLYSRPITSSSNAGPVCGAVIMGRFISDTFVLPSQNRIV
jgi:hypothetical protein